MSPSPVPKKVRQELMENETQQNETAIDLMTVDTEVRSQKPIEPDQH